MDKKRLLTALKVLHMTSAQLAADKESHTAQLIEKYHPYQIGEKVRLHDGRWIKVERRYVWLDFVRKTMCFTASGKIYRKDGKLGQRFDQYISMAEGI